MKFKKINENKIAITLSWKELASRDLDARTLRNNSVAYQKFFWDMMERVQEELDFDVRGSQLMVETKPDQEGNIVITITKSGGESNPQENLERFFSELFEVSGGASAKEEPKPVKTESVRYDTFRFDDFEDLIAFAKATQEICSLVNKLYCLENVYYLLVKSNTKTQKVADAIFDMAMEFNGYPLESSLWMSLLEERGKKIIRAKAIQTLAEKFL